MNPIPPSALRTKILESARCRFAEEGIVAASMRRIAADSGCSATAIYFHFKDKEALIEALSLEDFLLLAKKLAPLTKMQNPVERLRRMAESYGRFGLEKPHAYQFLFMTRKSAVKESRSLTRSRPEENAYLLLRKTVEEALSENRFNKGEPDLISQTLLAGIHGVVSLHLTNFDDPWIPWRPVKARIRYMVDSLLGGFAATEVLCT